MAVVKVKQIRCGEAKAVKELAALRSQLLSQADVISPRGKKLTQAVFGEALSPQRVVERICADVRARGLTAVLQSTGVSLAQFAALADDDAPPVIPLLGLAQAGQDGFFDEAGLPAADGWEQTDLPRASDTLFSLRITGDSMAPLYREGDRVIVDRAVVDVRRGDRVVVRTTGGETLAKEIAALNARQITLASINPAYAPRLLPRADIAWMARIQWVSQ